MIVQGSNEPITITFADEDNIPSADMSVSLRNEVREMKHWTFSDITVENDGKTYIVPISQTESMDWDAGPCVIEAKWLNRENLTVFLRLREKIVPWDDKTVLNVGV